ELKLLSDDIPNKVKGEQAIKKVLGGLVSTTQGLVEVRNLYGSGHGKHGRISSAVKPRHAKLMVGAATTLVMFFYETHSETFDESES
ncbi:MAG: abortive infection family protein, partial [Chloroflexota bacterium]